jgi:hypothetical protein
MNVGGFADPAGERRARCDAARRFPRRARDARAHRNKFMPFIKPCAGKQSISNPHVC